MQRSLLSAKDLNKKDILEIFRRADEMQDELKISKKVDTTKIGGLLFFEASTRTRIGIETASWRVGVNTVLMEEAKLNETMSLAESMADTIRTLNAYVTFYCVRHPDEQIFNEITPYTNHPIINCGNGNDEHPTQALIDAYAIWKRLGQLDGISATMIGPLKYSRAAHSLLILLSNFSGITINEISPEELQIQSKYKEIFTGHRNNYRRPVNHLWGEENVVYVTGFPQRNPSGTFSKVQRDGYKVTTEIVDKLAPDSIILDPLPRIDEIDKEVDDTPNAYYFIQNELGLYVRAAIIERFCL